jgi:hypothetical protein
MVGCCVENIGVVRTRVGAQSFPLRGRSGEDLEAGSNRVSWKGSDFVDN